MTRILQKENVILRKKAPEVPSDKFGGAEVSKIVSDMKKALEEEPDAVAVAAPQLGYLWKIFVVSKRVFEIGGKENASLEKRKDLIFINPKIIKKSKEKAVVDEGCLSVRWCYGLVKRAKRVTVEAFDMSGNKFRMGRSGLLAQIFQHEIDHLDGILFTDKATNLVEIPPKKKESGKTF